MTTEKYLSPEDRIRHAARTMPDHPAVIDEAMGVLSRWSDQTTGVLNQIISILEGEMNQYRSALREMTGRVAELQTWRAASEAGMDERLTALSDRVVELENRFRRDGDYAAEMRDRG